MDREVRQRMEPPRAIDETSVMAMVGRMYPEVARRLRPVAREYQDPLYLDLALNDRATLERFIGSPYNNNEDRVIQFLDRAEHGGAFDLKTAFIECANKVYNRCMIKLLQYDFDPKDFTFFTRVLNYACYRANEYRPLQAQVVTMLIAKGADPNSMWFRSDTFWHVCNFRQLEVLQALVNGGLDLSRESEQGQVGITFGGVGLRAAWNNRNTDMVRYLLSIPGVRIE